VVTDPGRERSLLESGWWTGTRLVDRLSSHASSEPDGIAVRDGEREITNAELDSDSARAASLLIECGIEPGDVVALQLPNWYSSVAVAVGAMKAGAVVNPMLPSYRAHELRHMLALGRTKVLITPDVYRDFDHRNHIAGLRADLPDLRQHLVLSPSLEALPGLPRRESTAETREYTSADVAEIIFTSGTEAKSKAVMHTERTLNANLRATWEALGMSHSDSVWMPAPIGHSTGFNHGLRLALYFGIPLILQDRWDAVEAIRLVERYRPTHTLLSTTFLSDLVRTVGSGPGDVSSLGLFGCGGATVPPELVARASEVGIRCLRLYGATEFLVATWNRPTSPMALRATTDGCPLPGVTVEVRDQNGDPVVGQVGEIFVQSPSGSVGLFRDDARTTETYNDGWIRSGDLGTLDSDGYLSVVGRRKEIIIRGGLNIAPREIEELLLQIPGVVVAAVLGLPDDRLGEITCACVVLSPGTHLSFQDMLSHLGHAGLARFKWPQRLEVVDEMPMTATGKIRKNVLMEWLLVPGTTR
jgi:acyl-CoA synthetase (AMP-forming)/AMP-acid ligase II